MTNVVPFPDKTPNAVEGLKRYAEKIKRKDFAIRDREWENEGVYNYRDIKLTEKQAYEGALKIRNDKAAFFWHNCQIWASAQEPDIQLLINRLKDIYEKEVQT